MNLSGYIEIMKRLCSEKDTEKETKEGAKKYKIEREKSMKNSEIGFSSPSPRVDFTADNKVTSSKSSNLSHFHSKAYTSSGYEW